MGERCRLQAAPKGALSHPLGLAEKRGPRGRTWGCNPGGDRTTAVCPSPWAWVQMGGGGEGERGHEGEEGGEGGRGRVGEEGRGEGVGGKAGGRGSPAAASGGRRQPPARRWCGGAPRQAGSPAGRPAGCGVWWPGRPGCSPAAPPGCNAWSGSLTPARGWGEVSQPGTPHPWHPLTPAPHRQGTFSCGDTAWGHVAAAEPPRLCLDVHPHLGMMSQSLVCGEMVPRNQGEGHPDMTATTTATEQGGWSPPLTPQASRFLSEGALARMLPAGTFP